MPARAGPGTEFWGQLLAFTVKNSLHLWRSRVWQVVILVLPAVAVGILSTLERSENVQPQVFDLDTPFFRLDDDAPLDCIVFDSLTGRLGLGVPIPNAWCAPMLFAPSASSDVVEVMRHVADRKGWQLQLLDGNGSAAGANGSLPDGCGDFDCLLGFESSVALGQWLEEHRGRAGTAIVFRDPANSTDGAPLADLQSDALPTQVLVEIWYNDTAMAYYTVEGENALAGQGNVPEQLLVAQHAVESGVLALRIGSDARAAVDFKRYPMLARKDFTDWVRRFGTLVFMAVLLAPTMYAYEQVVAERFGGVFAAMRGSGMNEAAFWLSYALQIAVIDGVVVCLMCAMGLALDLTLFAMVDFPVLLALLWAFGMALLAQACLIAAVVPSAAIAKYVLLASAAGQITAVTLTGENIILVFDPARLHPLVPSAVQLNCVVAFAKAMTDLTSVVSQVPKLDGDATYWVRDRRYETHDLYAGNYTGELRSLNINEYFVSPPTIESLAWMGVSTVACLFVAWYLTHAATPGLGRSQRLWFPLAPRFWLPSAIPRGNTSLLASISDGDVEARKRRTGLDADVAAEMVEVLTDRVVGHASVTLVDLTKRFGSVTAVDGVSVALAADEIFALLGHNGAGKSTVIKVMTGLKAPTSGDVLMYGMSALHDLRLVRKIVGHCPQHDVLYPALTAREHLYLYGRLRGVPTAELKDEIPLMLYDMRLSDVSDMLTLKLSGGMKRRLSVAIAYIGAPKVVVLDEPTTGMDPYNRTFVWEMIQGSRVGRTTLLTTHLMEEAEALGNQLAIMSRGQLVALGSAVHLKRRFGSGYSIKLVTKSSHAELLKAKVRELMLDAKLIDDAAGSCTFAIPADRMGHAGPLLEYIETLAHKKRRAGGARRRHNGERTPKLIDWLITRSTLEDVFINLAHGKQGQGMDGGDASSNPSSSGGTELERRGPFARFRGRLHHSAGWGKRNSNSTSGVSLASRPHTPSAARAASAQSRTQPAAAAPTADAAALAAAPAEAVPVHARQVVLDIRQQSGATVGESETAVARPWRATALKNWLTLRRSPTLLCCSFFMPVIVGFALFTFQYIFVDSTASNFMAENALLRDHVEEACQLITTAHDDSCKDRTDLGTKDECIFCATTDWDLFRACCLSQDSPWYDPERKCTDSMTHATKKNQCFKTRKIEDGVFGDCPSRDLNATELADLDSDDNPGYCECEDSAGERSAAVQERIDQTEMCKENNRIVLGRLTEDQVDWVGSDFEPGALDTKLPVPQPTAGRDRLDKDSWLAWTVPLFANASTSTEAVGYSMSSTGGAFLGIREGPVFGERKHAPGRKDQLMARKSELELSDVQFNDTRDLVVSISSSGLASHFPRAIARTDFGLRSGQPSSPCTVSKSTTKCCYRLEVQEFDIFQVFPDSVFEYCGELGASCPRVWTNDNVEEYLRQEWGLSDTHAKAQSVRYLLNASATYRLGVGRSYDYEGRETRCVDDEPPICRTVRSTYTPANETTSLTCAQIRNDRDKFSTSASDYEWNDDLEWECTSAECVEYEIFVAPAYTNDRWRSQRKLREHVLAEQVKIRSNLYMGVLDVDVNSGHTTSLNVAEYLFPSWSVEVGRLDLDKGQVAWTLTSFFRRLGGGDGVDYFYVTEPINADSVGGSYENRLRESLNRSFALGNAVLAREMPMVIMNGFTNSLLQTKLGSSYNLKLGLRPMPSENAFNRDDPTLLYTRLLGIGLRSLVPLFASTMMPIFTYSVVQEKHFKLRSLMKMMGMRISSYWSVEWTFASSLSHGMMLLLWGFGCLSPLRFFRRSWGALLLLFQVWAQLQVSIAFLASVFFQRTRTAIVLMYIFIVASAGTGLYLWETASVPNAEISWRLIWDLYPPFAFYHCVYIITTKGFRIGELFDTNEEFSIALLLMALHPLWIYPLAVYLDAVLPRELGASEHPLFCLHGIISRLRRRRQVDRGRDASMSINVTLADPNADPTSVLTRDFVSPNEDPDVTAEREVLEQGLQDPNCPVQVFSLRKVFPGGKLGINNLTLRIDHGECFGLLGPNGAGKTTTISVLSGLYPPTSGTAFLSGRNIRTQIGEVQRMIGMCPQFDTLWPRLTVRDHMLFYCRVRGVPPSEMRRESEAIAHAVGLTDKLDQHTDTLSGGQKRRVSLGTALVGSPSIIFLDEPTTGLDPETKRAMWQLIDSFKARSVIILTTHSMDEADALCDRIGIMANGELRCIGTTVHLKNKYGEGYKIAVQHEAGAERAVQDFISRTMPRADLLSVSGRSRTYSVRKGDVSIRHIFERMELREAASGITDWSLRQTSLQEVFVRIAMDAEEANDEYGS